MAASEIKDLAQKIEAKQMGPRKLIWVKRNLAELQADLKELNAKIRKMKAEVKLSKGVN